VSSANHQPPTSPQTARDRVAARRAARRLGLRRQLLLALGLVAALAVVALALVLLRANRALTTIQQEDPRRRPTVVASQGIGSAAQARQATQAPPPNALREPVNILLVGVDKRPNPEESVRSDTLILVHLDPQARWAAMLSIPRDSVVNVPHLGQAKINTAYAYGYINAAEIYGAGTDPDAGGGALVAETVEKFLKVSVDYIAQVDFRGFERVVDSIGGVVVDVPAPLLDAEYPTDDYGVERVYIPAGLQVLDGRAALIYARSRHSSTDFDRSKRQQMVLRALLEQVRARGLLENATSLPQWAALLEQNIRTTLPINDLGMINGLAALARDLKGDQIVQLSINPNDVAIDQEDGSDIYWNKADLATLVARWQAGPQGAREMARVQVINGAAVEGIAGQVSAYLRGQGFALADPGTATRVYEHTLVIDYTGQPETRQRVADALGIEPRYIQAKPEPDAPPQAYQVDVVVVVGKDYQERWIGQ
jgi:polyisoprenyl-teichoic acid--peptidoglycan teichoic acid transferase